MPKKKADITLDVELLAKLRKRATAEGRSLSNLINFLLTQAVKKKS